MHFHLPKPLHGWRAFAGEVGIIVVGVLIALAAEQLIENMRWRNEVTEFRSAADSELADNLAGFRYRLRQERCLEHRIAELERWGQSRGAQPLKGEIGRPSVIINRTSVWNTRGDALAHMPLAVRLDYSGIYDLLDNVHSQIEDEREAWRNLAAFNHARSLSADQAMRLDELLYRAKSIDRVLRLNWGPVMADATRLGVRPGFGDNGRFIPPPDPAFCRPVAGG